MQEKEAIVFFENACQEIGITLNQTQQAQFMEYKRLLLEWNQKVNLTAITEEKEILSKHFVDCLSILAHVKHNKVIDVGTGAGFPGLVLKIARPELDITLLDSLQKRIYFLEEVCARLSLSSVRCIHARAEDGARNQALRENFDVCVSRAVANLSVLAEYCLPFVAVGGHFLALKGPDTKAELAQAQPAIIALGGAVKEVLPITLSQSGITHSLIMIEKLCQTPARFPRKAGKIIKNPIK